uniref:Uncharacterized protein n=1 Tax=Anguilla anguilla TaxID=7936 RepID=A0A0E9TWI1_ANGAN
MELKSGRLRRHGITDLYRQPSKRFPASCQAISVNQNLPLTDLTW